MAIGEDLRVNTANTTVFGRQNDPVATGTSSLTPLTSALEIGIGDYLVTGGHEEEVWVEEDYGWWEEQEINGELEWVWVPDIYGYWETIWVEEFTGSRANGLTVLYNGKTTLKNRYWNANSPTDVPYEEITIGGQTKDGAGAGVALEVKGHAVLEGNVTILHPQGDIGMGMFGAPPPSGE